MRCWANRTRCGWRRSAGDEGPLIDIPHWDFEWQFYYRFLSPGWYGTPNWLTTDEMVYFIWSAWEGRGRGVGVWDGGRPCGREPFRTEGQFQPGTRPNALGWFDAGASRGACPTRWRRVDVDAWVGRDGRKGSTCCLPRPTPGPDRVHAYALSGPTNWAPHAVRSPLWPGCRRETARTVTASGQHGWLKRHDPHPVQGPPSPASPGRRSGQWPGDARVRAAWASRFCAGTSRVRTRR